MKRLLIVALLMLGMASARAEEPVTFRVLTSFKITSLTTASASTAGRALLPQTRFIRALCTAACFLAVPVSPIVAAHTAPVYLAGGIPEYFIVSPGAWVQVIADSGTGTLHISEMTR